MRTISIISLFPQALSAYLNVGMMAKAQAQKVVKFELIDLRQYGLGRHRQVDDTPYGGGPGMILRIEPLVAAIEDAQSRLPEPAQAILLTPRGQMFDQAAAGQLADSGSDFILVGGRYEGYDERLVRWVDQQISVGHYVLTGAELPALIIADSVVRLMDGVLRDEETVKNESFADDGRSVEYPQYTKPEVFRELAVPAVLKSGNHQQIAAWRKEQTKKVGYN